MSDENLPPFMFRFASRDSSKGEVASLTMQLFADLIERYDLLLLEARHLQTNLINSMRFPLLHAALRYEESFIFGGVEIVDHTAAVRNTQQIGWTELFNHRKITLKRLPDLSEVFVPVLPITDDDPQFEMDTGDLYSSAGDRAFPEFNDLFSNDVLWREVVAPITRDLRRRRLTNRWDDNFDMNYNVFVALQSLKRNIVYDKLHIAWYGARCFSDPAMEPLRTQGTANDDAERRADLLMARGIALKNLERHTERLADFQAQFEKTLDIGSQENHRPITGRRREQGIYHFMLNERVRDMFVECSEVVEMLLDSREGRHPFPGMPTLVHRWAYRYASEINPLVSFSRGRRIDRHRTGEEDEGASADSTSSVYSAFAVNTSFWMPDRPDLQPIIAHETAHCVLAEVFNEFSEPLQHKDVNGVLVDLWRALINEDNQTTVGTSQRDPIVDMREVVADILAATVNGPSYLFALLQKILGYGLGSLCERPDWSGWVDLGKLETVLRGGLGHQPVDLRWYYRLMITIDTVSAVSTKEEHANPLTEALIRAAREVCTCIIDRVGDLKDEHDKGFVKDWKEYTRHLVVRIRLTGLHSELQAYRNRRQPGSHKVDLDNRDSTKPDYLDEPLAYSNLPPMVRWRLVEHLIERKCIGEDRGCRGAMTDRRFQQKLVNDEGLNRQFFDGEFLGRTYTRDNLLQLVRENSVCAADAIALFGVLYCDSSSAAQARILKLRGEVRTASAEAAATKKAMGVKPHENHPLKAKHKAQVRARRAALDAMCAEIPWFYHLRDIPWQTNFARAAELAASSFRNTAKPRCLLTTLTTDYAPGRESTQLAIEFWSYGRRRTIDGLSELVRVLRDMIGCPVSSLSLGKGKTDPQHRLLWSVVDNMLPSTAMNLTLDDIESMRGQVRALVKVWERGIGGSEIFQRLCSASEQIIEDIIVEGTERNAVTAGLVAAIEDAIRCWMGTDLDGDFHELALRSEIGKTSSPTNKDLDVATRALAFRLAREERAENLVREWDDWLSAQGCGQAGFKAEALKSLNAFPTNYQERKICAERFSGLLERFTGISPARIIAMDGGPITLGELYGAFPVDPSGFGLLDEHFEKNLTDLEQSPTVGRLRDGLTQAIRIFEIPTLKEAIVQIKDRSFASASQANSGSRSLTARLGALQILKLDRSYPDVVFPFRLDRKSICSADILARLWIESTGYPDSPVAFSILDSSDSPPERTNKFLKWSEEQSTGSAPETSAVIDEAALTRRIESIEPAQVETFIVEAIKSAEKDRCTGTIASAASVAAIAASSRDYIHEALGGIARNDPTAILSAYRTLVSCSDDFQRESRPVAIRSKDYRTSQRNVIEVADRKIRELKRLFHSDALGGQELEPMRSLLDRHADRRGYENRALREMFSALSKPVAGLRMSRNVLLARQSLIDAHWQKARPWFRDNAFEHAGMEAEKEARSGIFRVPGACPDGPIDPELRMPVSRSLTTLGRYDFFSFSNDPVLGSYRLPVMDRNLGMTPASLYTTSDRPFSRIPNERLYSTFFERRESAIALSLKGWPIELTGTNIQPGVPRCLHYPNERKDVLCVLSLRLDRRSSRIGFLQRLRRAQRAWSAFSTDANTRDHNVAMAFRNDLSKNEILETDSWFACPKWRRSFSNRLKTAFMANPFGGDSDTNFEEARRLAEEIFNPTVEFENRGQSNAKIEDLYDRVLALCPSNLDKQYPKGAIFSQTQLAMETVQLCGDLPQLSVEAAGFLIDEGDSVLLGEGWGDLYLVLHCDRLDDKCSKEERERWVAKGARRLYNIFALQHSLFQDHEVYRTEMFLRPAALAFAAGDAMARFQLSLAVRLREDRELDGLIQRAIETMRDNASRSLLPSLVDNNNPKDLAALVNLLENPSTNRKAWHKMITDLQDRVTISHVPGRNDLEFWIKNCGDVHRANANGTFDALSELEPTEAINALHKLAGSGLHGSDNGSEEISTRVGFRHFITSASSYS